MARNQAGTMTIPNTFSVDTTANPDKVNENFTDIANEITGSLARDGRGGMTGQLVGVAGTLAAPGLALGADTNSGFMLKSDGVWAFVVNGVEAFTLTAAGLVITNPNVTPVYDLGTQTTGTVAVDYDNGVVQKLTMAGPVNILPTDIPEGRDLQLNLTFSSGALTFSGVTRWSLGTEFPSASFADTGLDPASLPVGCVLTIIFSRVGNEIIGFVARVK